MLKDHAIVETQGYKIPLIGVPPDAMLEECGLCHDQFPLSKVELVDNQMLCSKCRKNNLTAENAENTKI